MTSGSRLELGRTYLRLLRRTLLRIDRVSGALIGPHGLTNQQFLALFLIRQNVGLSQAELTAELESDQNTVSDMVRRLASRGLVTREPHPSDRRTIRLVVTPAGEACLEQAQPDIDRLSLRLAALMPEGHEGAIVGWLDMVASLQEL